MKQKAIIILQRLLLSKKKKKLVCPSDHILVKTPLLPKLSSFKFFYPKCPLSTYLNFSLYGKIPLERFSAIWEVLV